MSTSEPAVPASGTGTATSGTVRYSVPEASRHLGISERAVRKRIDAGTLLAVREGRAWVVYVEEPASGTSTAESAVPAEPSEPDAVPVPEPVAVPGGTVDLAPLVDLIADLTRRNEQLTEAATVWQIRAVQAEEKLKQLTAGSVEPEPRAEAREASPQAQGEAESPKISQDTSQSQRPWWRRLLGM